MFERFGNTAQRVDLHTNAYYSATDSGAATGTATVTVTITNKLEFSGTTLTGCVEAGAAAGKSRSNKRILS